MPGHGATFWMPREGANSGNIYLAMALRNGGAGLAVIHGWRVQEPEPAALAKAPDPRVFRRQLRDLYIPADNPR